MPSVNTDNFNVYLKEFSHHLHLEGKKALLVMDGAGWHKSKELVVPSNIEIMIQPPYSPELNPIEKLWQFIKRHTIKNRVFKTVKEIERALCDFIKQMTVHDYKSVCRTKYLMNT